MSERVSVRAKEFQAFLAENQQLVERYEKLLERVGGLMRANKDFEEKLHMAEAKIQMMEQRIGADVEQADETLRKARATMARLMEEADRRLSE